jgi:hypothetical protein
MFLKTGAAINAIKTKPAIPYFFLHHPPYTLSGISIIANTILIGIVKIIISNVEININSKVLNGSISDIKVLF